jgi:hypothetical protein
VPVVSWECTVSVRCYTHTLSVSFELGSVVNLKCLAQVLKIQFNVQYFSCIHFMQLEIRAWGFTLWVVQENRFEARLQLSFPCPTSMVGSVGLSLWTEPMNESDLPRA